jgi:hypothetical protein
VHRCSTEPDYFFTTPSLQEPEFSRVLQNTKILNKTKLTKRECSIRKDQKLACTVAPLAAKRFQCAPRGGGVGLFAHPIQHFLHTIFVFGFCLFLFHSPVFIHVKKRGHLTDNRIQTNRNRCTESRFILRCEYLFVALCCQGFLCFCTFYACVLAREECDGCNDGGRPNPPPLQAEGGCIFAHLCERSAPQELGELVCATIR